MIVEPDTFSGIMQKLKDEAILIPLNEEHVVGTLVLEPPCRMLAGVGTRSSLSIGAFSYAYSFISVNIAKVGRYCSIAEGTQFGHVEHPTNWLTTSSCAYILGEAFWPTRPESGFVPQLLPDEQKRRPINIGNDVWIGHHAYVRSGTTLGDGCIVGAHAVVTKDVPPYAIVVGNPARIVKYRFDEVTIQRLLKLRWWDYDFNDFDGVRPDQIAQACDRLEELIDRGMRPYKPSVLTMRGDGCRGGLQLAVDPSLLGA